MYESIYYWGENEEGYYINRPQTTEYPLCPYVHAYATL